MLKVLRVSSLLASLLLPGCVQTMSVSSDIPGLASSIATGRQRSMMATCPRGNTFTEVREGTTTVRGMRRTQVTVIQTC